jgi:myo-inositol-1(or 4)-monophosphatase
MQASVVAELTQRWPDIAVLGEEMTAEQHAALMQQSHGRIWLLDPLDGTSNYAAGLPYFSVSIALMEQGKVVLALVYDPLRDECFTAEAGKGASLNDVPLKLADCDLPPLSKCLAAVDFKRLDSAMATRLAASPPYASQRSLGSVALDLCWLAAGRFHVYLHGRHQIWDYAAGHRILAEAGGLQTTLDGTIADVANMQSRSTAAAGNESLMQAWCDALGINWVN